MVSGRRTLGSLAVALLALPSCASAPPPPPDVARAPRAGPAATRTDARASPGGRRSRRLRLGERPRERRARHRANDTPSAGGVLRVLLHPVVPGPFDVDAARVRADSVRRLPAIRRSRNRSRVGRHRPEGAVHRDLERGAARAASFAGYARSERARAANRGRAVRGGLGGRRRGRTSHQSFTRRWIRQHARRRHGRGGGLAALIGGILFASGRPSAHYEGQGTVWDLQASKPPSPPPQPAAGSMGL